MSAHLKRFLPLLAGGVLLAFGGAAAACDKGCKPPPPPCCHQPKPPAPPKTPDINIKNKVNVNVNVHTQATAVAVANSNASASGGGDSFFFGGGGANIIATPGFPVIQKLNVMGDTVKKAFTEKRTLIKTMAVQAICIDDRGAPHPASRLTPDQDIAEHFSGELFRCIAGTRLQATFAEFAGKAHFDGGQTIACGKGEALYHERGELTCRKQTAQRNCFERSLLRRHGAGFKVFKMTKIEEYTSFKEEVQTASHEIALDGGVGGFVH